MCFIFVGVEDLSKELSSAMSAIAMPDGFDVELFEDQLRADFTPLDLDGVQMLTDSSLVADPATEDSFRMDRL